MSAWFDTLRLLPADGRLLFAARIVRLFAYGSLSVVLVLYLVEIGLSEAEAGLLLTITLIGDTLISFWLTTNADRIGRRRTLLAGVGLMVVAGALFTVTGNFWLLVFAAIIGVLSPSGSEVGPFLPIEQAALSQITPNDRRTDVFAWYNLTGSFATAAGALAGGALASALQGRGVVEADSYRAVIALYALLGIVLALITLRLSPEMEPPPVSAAGPARRFGLHRSRGVVFRLSTLFGIDAFAGGFAVQSFIAYWFYLRFGVDAGLLGGIFFGTNILAGFSALAAARIASHVGLINTMVFTHIPSSILLMMLPFVPTLPLAIGVLLLRACVQQMDVPTRQSYTMAVVDADERSAAAGVTGIARTTGASIAPVFTGLLLGNPALVAVPFLVSGGLKIVYDLALWRMFRSIKPPEEAVRSRTAAD